MSNIPSFSSADINAVNAVIKPDEKETFRDLTASVKELEKSQKMLEYIKADPKKAKIMSLLTTAIALSVIISGILAGSLCLKYIPVMQTKFIVGGSLLGGTYIISTVIGIINGIRWRIDLIGQENYAFPFTVPIEGAFGPAVKVFANCYEKDYKHALGSFQYKHEQCAALIQKISDNESEDLESVKLKLNALALITTIV